MPQREAPVEATARGALGRRRCLQTEGRSPESVRCGQEGNSDHCAARVPPAPGCAGEGQQGQGPRSVSRTAAAGLQAPVTFSVLDGLGHLYPLWHPPRHLHRAGPTPPMGRHCQSPDQMSAHRAPQEALRGRRALRVQGRGPGGVAGQQPGHCPGFGAGTALA